MLKTKTTQEILVNLITEGNGVLDITSLTPDMFNGDKFMLSTFFTYNNHSLGYFHFNEDLFEQNYEELNQYFNDVTKARYNKNNNHYETATTYNKAKLRKAYLELLLKTRYLANVSITFEISFEGYKTNDIYYEYPCYTDSIEYAEYDHFRETSKPIYELKSKDAYIYIPTNVPDTETVSTLKTLCNSLIKLNLAMTLNLTSYLSIINKIEGKNAVYASDNEIAKRQLNKLIKDLKELAEWINAGNNDITLYLFGEKPNSDMYKAYIETYHTCIGMYEGFGIFDVNFDVNEIKNTLFYESLKIQLYSHTNDEEFVNNILSEIYTKDIYDDNYSYIENADWKGETDSDEDEEETFEETEDENEEMDL